eukprot:6731190-Ditylum_brightwellii.AAC.2
MHLELSEGLNKTNKSEKKKICLMKSKSIQVGVRGRHIIDDVATLEDELKKIHSKTENGQEESNTDDYYQESNGSKKYFLGGAGLKETTKSLGDKI